ncbi:MAG: lipid A biosynthesis (KDO)2-(lauroyl)-lipid IVA acyltransferase [Tannerella sp.]|jgi:predicted LPLAT superfamily acyltransferase|nr:lipid A biosynthesis (KDO)2-(lauroyl)-lipid IVA acyltransferase [Tannerella sp.]
MAGKERAWKGVTGGSVFGQKAMKILFSIVNVYVGYFILLFVIPFYMLFARKGYLAIYRYFRRQHGYPAVKSFFKTYGNHFMFGQMILDRFAVYAGQRNFKIDNPDNDLFLRMVYAQHGCIVASAHVGNPELCSYLLKQKTKRINSMIFGRETKEVQENRRLALADNNVRLIPVSEDMSHIFLINEALTNGEMVSMLCDRAFGSNKTVECDFLNGKVDFPIGPFALAMQFNVPVIAMFVMKVTASLYRIHVMSLAVPTEGDKRRQINEMTRSFVKILEGIVKKYPEQWFNFYNFWKNEDVPSS